VFAASVIRHAVVLPITQGELLLTTCCGPAVLNTHLAHDLGIGAAAAAKQHSG
jgi:hypothetical protein